MLDLSSQILGKLRQVLETEQVVSSIKTSFFSASKPITFLVPSKKFTVTVLERLSKKISEEYSSKIKSFFVLKL